LVPFMSLADLLIVRCILLFTVHVFMNKQMMTTMMMKKKKQKKKKKKVIKTQLAGKHAQMITGSQQTSLLADSVHVSRCARKTRQHNVKSAGVV